MAATAAILKINPSSEPKKQLIRNLSGTQVSDRGHLGPFVLHNILV